MNRAHLVAFCLAISLFPACGERDRQADLQIELIKFVSHPALDDTERGIIDHLRAWEAERGLVVEIGRKNAKGSPQIAKQLAEIASTGGTDLIIAIATPAAQAVARTPSPTPLIYGAVSDPEGAGIIASGKATGIKNVGPHIIETALQFMREAFPEAAKLGSVYNPAEQNSQYVQDLIQERCAAYGFSYTSAAVNGSTQVATAAEALSAKVDLIYSANDNTVNSAIGAVAAIAQQTSTPLILGDLSTLESGALAAVGLEYYQMGKEVGKMAVEVLEGRPVTEIPPQNAPPAEIWYNEGVANKMGIEIPESARTMVDKFVGEN